MKILIVDDDPVCRRVLREILTGESEHQITEAADGNEAWALLDNPSLFYDIVFLDVTMPPPDGLKILRRIRESPILRSVRVVMCTAANDKVTVGKVVQLGGRHFIVKPATAPLVLAKVRQIEAELAAEAPPRNRLAGVVAR